MKKYCISGKVVKGLGYGRKLGYPTANIERRGWARLTEKPKTGVWAGWMQLKIENRKLKINPSPSMGDGKGWGWHKAAVVIGPLDQSGLPKIEAHLLNFTGNLYGKKITIVLEKYLRPFRKFKTEAELKKQIGKDVHRVRKFKNRDKK